MDGSGGNSNQVSKSFRLPVSDHEFSSRVAIVEASNVLSGSLLQEFKAHFNKAQYPEKNEKNAFSDKALQACLKQAGISDFEYAMLYALQKLKSLIDQRNSRLFLLVDPEERRLNSLNDLDKPLSKAQPLQIPDSELDIELFDHKFEIFQRLHEEYSHHVGSKVSGKLALMENLAARFPFEVIPSLLQVSLNYLMNPLVVRALQKSKNDLFHLVDFEVADRFIEGVTKSFRVDSRKNQPKLYDHFQISSDYKKYVSIIREIRMEEKPEHSHYYANHISLEQFKKIISRRRDSVGDLSIELVIDKYKLKSKRVVVEANTEANRLFGEFLRKTGQVVRTPAKKNKLGLRPISRSKTQKRRDEFLRAVEFFADQFFSGLIPRASSINLLESLEIILPPQSVRSGRE